MKVDIEKRPQRDTKFPIFLERGGQGVSLRGFEGNSSPTLLSREKGAGQAVEVNECRYLRKDPREILIPLYLERGARGE
ncbi:MAG TPA: hypothetical protein VF941_21935, partial [Clostridia bacterium]